jgi:hypothetical protein
MAWTDYREWKFWLYINSDGPNGCWIWGGCRSKGGYGTISIDNKELYVHRVIYERTHGPIPAGMCICHTCDNPACCNPDHLFVGTHKDNVHDAMRKGRR